MAHNNTSTEVNRWEIKVCSYMVKTSTLQDIHHLTVVIILIQHVPILTLGLK